MPRVKVQRNQVTLPDDLREILLADDEDEVEAEVVDEGVLLRRSDSARRRAAYDRIRSIQGRVRLSPDLAALPADELEERVAALIEADRKEAAARGHK